ncbi:bifunctional homocysteine S-methyltransferase/methylenetetrahydrofolate reductase [Sutcliffiella rhizosphaerae]|uniref:Bifunctional homocysteine S-methyltransferase/5,10-methylenetetrahydrofolate reductase n=1 Tax=Sutcliffiella rhizosphaerae TaxID=2880967 RepID=A0ABM8YPZ7_9BACI|nr:bifunctional homocysteine S-methyltransferase/methylenetetrahydrofolate reductase [Sutcliffiella rhizosphaerae]CAG9622075.1 Bifunctional homocysteine S-methyltransferase/5,10-methylenetetrahydrofolate reductase [Sutcliffiella rhizosphaerae]
MGILDSLQQDRILIADGAMGTLLYSYGSDSCFEELNLSHPDQIFHIHQAYLNAGANIIQTNTYAANYHKLERYGLQDQVKEINSAAVKLAKKAVLHHTGSHVVGTIGGIRAIKPETIPLEEIKRTFREQLYCLLLEGVDGILLETFYDLEELETVLQIARKETDLPIISQVSLQEVGYLQNRVPITDALNRLEAFGADIVGLNCRLGPYHMISTLEEVSIPKHAFLSAYPNASLPSYVDGKLEYDSDAGYFKETALAFRDQGVRLLGGCCGTTPAHIQAFSEALRDVSPVKEKQVKRRERTIVIPSQKKDVPTPLFEKAKKEQSIIVELDPPRKLNTDKFLRGAQALKDTGIDALTMADNSLASPRVCNTALGSIVKSQVGLRPLIHITCRDRNLIGLQSHLMGLHQLGIHDILAITGDPTKVGDFPGASSVYDVTSFGLINMIKQFNQGVSLSGKELGERTSFSVGAAFNPNVRVIDKAVERLEKKIEAGADYFISQPVFSEEKLLEVYHATKHINAPIYIGIMPLTSSRNANFLHHEVPGIKLTQPILDSMNSYRDNPEQASLEGLNIAKGLLDAALELFNGIYLITPFMRYELTVELASYAKKYGPSHTSRRVQNV